MLVNNTCVVAIADFVILIINGINNKMFRNMSKTLKRLYLFFSPNYNEIMFRVPVDYNACAVIK